MHFDAGLLCAGVIGLSSLNPGPDDLLNLVIGNLSAARRIQATTLPTHYASLR